MGRKNAKMMATALRSFFRFLFLRGETSAPLAGVVPNVAHWRLSTIPLFLKPQEIERVLNTCDHTTPAGQRNHAVLLLLARLGLRAGEVLRLRRGRRSLELHPRLGPIAGSRRPRTGHAE